MAPDGNLKQRIADGGPVNVAWGSLDMDRAELEDMLAEEDFDLTFVDVQHNPLDENLLVRFCETADELGAPVLLRIPHPRQAYMCGRYLDMGPLAIVVPMVETEEIAREAVEAFYYPPLGRRSWWPAHAYGHEEDQEQRKYADWWNETGILMLQIESVDSVLNAPRLAVSGVDILTFGTADMRLDIESYDDPPFTSFGEARDAVLELTRGMDIRVAASELPVGRL